MADIKIGLNNLKTHIDETIHREIEDLKHNFIEAMRADIMRLQTYKMFPYEVDTYIKRNDVLKIFEKFTEGESNEETDSN